jgi:hypothetical protein
MSTEIDNVEYIDKLDEVLSISKVKANALEPWLEKAVAARLQRGTLEGVFMGIGLAVRLHFTREYNPNKGWTAAARRWWGALSGDQQLELVKAYRLQAEKVKRGYELMDSDTLFNKLYEPKGSTKEFKASVMGELFELREDLENLGNILRLNGAWTEALADLREHVDDEGACRLTQFGEIDCMSAVWLVDWRSSVSWQEPDAWWILDVENAHIEVDDVS